MKVWKLTPLQSEGYVRIRAESEAKAREVAYHTFKHRNVKEFMHTKDWSDLEWNDPTQVKCEYEDEDISNSEGILDIL